ncbi:regulatory protein RecX [Pseudolysinimonas sp.]|uniref:regulatory protein RecX n=1 Tax=Pseudolysinimonas sp. TaxID=2680009 RepID=UPI0037841DB8
MQRLDDGALARVTYLPGVLPPHPEETPSSRSAFSAEEEPAWAVPGAGAADPAPVGAAHHVSITALSRRGLSRRETERHLRDRGFEEQEIADEVSRLERDGYLDDVALAQNLVGTLQERKGLGRSAIAAELTRRLLAPAAIEYALDLIDSGDELSRARDVAVKRAGQLRNLDRDVAVRRLSAFLARRGYGGSTIRAAVDHALPLVPRRGVVFR